MGISLRIEVISNRIWTLFNRRFDQFLILKNIFWLRLKTYWGSRGRVSLLRLHTHTYLWWSHSLGPGKSLSCSLNLAAASQSLGEWFCQSTTWWGREKKNTGDTREQVGEGKKMCVGGGEGRTERGWVFFFLLTVSESSVKFCLCIPDAVHTNAYSARAAYLDSRVSLRWLEEQEARVRNGVDTEG